MIGKIGQHGKVTHDTFSSGRAESQDSGSSLIPNAPPRRLRVISECGVLIGLALALAQLRLFQLPSGGSISIGSLPLLLVAARHGAFWGSLAGAIAGLLSAAAHPYIVHPIQFLLDYPLAFGSLGLAGCWRWQPPWRAIAGVTLAGAVKLHCHVAAGVVFFSAGLPPGAAAWAGSYLYNLSHMLPETVLCATIGWILAARHPHLLIPHTRE